VQIPVGSDESKLELELELELLPLVVIGVARLLKELVMEPI
jgi:hypothetical protein